MTLRPTLLIALLLPLTVQAERLEDPDPARIRGKLDRLDLTAEQALALVPLLDEAAALRLESCTQVEKLAPEISEAWGALRDVVAMDGTSDPAIWKRAGALEREIRARQEEMGATLIALEDEAMEILEPGQQAIFEPRGKGELHELQREVRELSDQRHPKPGRLGQALQQPVVAKELYALAGQEPPALWTQARDSCDAVKEDRRQLRELKQEISAWNLLNGLHLSAEQAEALLSAKHETEAEAALDPGQWEVLRGFSPCLLPPQDLSNPVRAGQAGAGGRYEKWLERARSLDEAGQAYAIRRLLDKERAHLGPLPEGRAEEVEAILAEASMLDEVDYAIREPELMERLVRENDLKAARLALREARGAAGGEGLAGHFLLSDAFLDVLSQRFGGEG